jgi:aspartate/methionine/tyrosine aminotransferase
MAVINFPHNPTGKLIRHHELEQIIEHCAGNEFWLFSDEVFRGLEYRRSDQLTPVAALHEKGINLGVMSKAFGLGGVRIGWIAGRDQTLIKRMLEIKHCLSICSGRTDELLAMIALQHAPQLLDNTRKLIQRNLQRLRSACSNHSDIIHWHQPDAGCVAYPKLANGVDSRNFAKRLLDQTEVMIIPGHCFMWGEAHFRIGFGRRDFPLALKRFSNHIDSFRP